MRHPDQQEFQRLIDGELSRRRAHKVSAHVRSCPECAAAVERIRATGALLRLAVDDMIADAPLEGLSDRVLSEIGKEETKGRLSFTERFRTWFGEFIRYRQKVWAPPLALAGAAAAVLLVVFTVGSEAPPIERPPSSTVMSVSFGSSVDGTVFELEDKDGSTTAVIWVDEGKSVASDANSEAKQGIHRWNDDSGTKRT
jgi:anti-sigma factor RsiW